MFYYQARQIKRKGCWVPHIVVTIDAIPKGGGEPFEKSVITWSELGFPETVKPFVATAVVDNLEN